MKMIALFCCKNASRHRICSAAQKMQCLLYCLFALHVTSSSSWRHVLWLRRHSLVTANSMHHFVSITSHRFMSCYFFNCYFGNNFIPKTNNSKFDTEQCFLRLTSACLFRCFDELFLLENTLNYRRWTVLSSFSKTVYCFQSNLGNCETWCKTVSSSW